MRITDTLLSPNGRLTRAGFWGAWLGIALVTVMAAFSLAKLADYLTIKGGGLITGEIDRPLWIALMLAIPLTWMAFCLLVKRWHDRGRSGWWLILALVPLVGQVWALVECGFLAGTRGGNKYGPSPLRTRYDHALHFGEDITDDMA